MSHASQEAQPVVVLGASNAVRGLPFLVHTAQQACGAPLELWAAIGHGRGYARSSWVLGRHLPPIADCGVWESLQRRPGRPAAALLTDIGNDLLYGATAEETAAALATCLERLRDACDRMVITRLPLSRVSQLSERSFLLFRTLLFPRSRVTWDETRRAAEQLDERVAELAERYDAHPVSPQPAWYGWDPIHIRSACQQDAWQSILQPWSRRGAFSTRVPDRQLRRQLRSVRPAYRRMWGFEQRFRQPSCRLPDGSRLSCY